MPLRPRPEVEQLRVCPHGGPNYAEAGAAGLTPGKIMDLSVSSNPFMPPPGIKRTISRAIIGQYPDSEAIEFRRSLAGTLGIAPDNIIAGSGTIELIRLIALAYFRPGDGVLLLEPTFGEYEVAIQLAGAKTIKYRSSEANGFAPQTEEVIRLIKQRRPRAVFLCNPNNPTGHYLSRTNIEAISQAIGDDGMLILDEAYVTFVESTWDSTKLITRNVIILRSMTKDYGLAGLRLGYAIAGRDIIANLRKVCPPWNVNAVALEIGTAALHYTDYLEQTNRKIIAAREYLIARLTALGLTPLPSDANFFLVRVGNARKFRAALLKKGMMVRDCTSFGLPEYIRIAPRTLPECRKLINAIMEIRE
ncbi:MAG: histidinol-phosphate transaminase [Dehalococcoidales bacterium]|nr:histidinol-phosphate transaminase [Dehalococcoidales bacterium]